MTDEHAYLIAAEQARQAAEHAIDHFRVVEAEFAAADPEAYSHYASLFVPDEPDPEPEAPEPVAEDPLTLPGPRSTSLEGAIRDMLSEDRARRGVA